MKRPEKIPRCHGMSGGGFSKDIITHSGKKAFHFPHATLVGDILLID